MKLGEVEDGSLFTQMNHFLLQTPQLLNELCNQEKTFHSVHRKALWDILRLNGIPALIVGLIGGNLGLRVLQSV